MNNNSIKSSSNNNYTNDPYEMQHTIAPSEASSEGISSNSSLSSSSNSTKGSREESAPLFFVGSSIQDVDRELASELEVIRKENTLGLPNELFSLIFNYACFDDSMLKRVKEEAKKINCSSQICRFRVRGKEIPLIEVVIQRIENILNAPSCRTNLVSYLHGLHNKNVFGKQGNIDLCDEEVNGRPGLEEVLNTIDRTAIEFIAATWVLVHDKEPEKQQALIKEMMPIFISSMLFRTTSCSLEENLGALRKRVVNWYTAPS